MSPCGRPAASTSAGSTTGPSQFADTAAFQGTDLLLVLFAAGVWGGSFLFMDIALDHFEPGLVTAFRVWFGAAAVWALPSARQPVAADARSKLIVLGVVWMALPLTLFPVAQQWIDSGLAGMLNSAMPIMTTILAATVFGAVVLRRQVAGVLVGFAGIVLIGLPEASGGGSNALGVGLVVAAVACYGIAVNVAGPLQQRFGSAAVVARALLTASLLVVPGAVVALPGSSFSWAALVACFAAGAGGTGYAFVAAATLTGRVGAVRTSLITYVVPIIAIVLGIVFRDETLSVWAAAGTIVVLAGAAMASRVPAPSSPSGT
ncbi:MAG: DMT family transporter [Acidimicrobiales bacterium]|nr:DMT family transporter [Acidimicrobiales bacterium]